MFQSADSNITIKCESDMAEASGENYKWSQNRPRQFRTALSLVLLALGLQTLQRASAVTTVRMGAILPLSGTFGDNGKRGLTCLQIALAEVNANRTLLPGVTIELFVNDSRSLPQYGDYTIRNASRKS